MRKPIEGEWKRPAANIELERAKDGADYCEAKRCWAGDIHMMKPGSREKRAKIKKGLGMCKKKEKRGKNVH